MSNELLDILDDQGVPVGHCRPRGEVHRDGLWHQTVHVWVYAKGHLLLQHRSHTKDTNPNKWDISAAGHIDAGEPLMQAALREFREELGCEVHTEQLVSLGKIATEYRCKQVWDREWQHLFLVEVPELDALTFKVDPEEVQEVKWVPLEIVEGMVNECNSDLVPHTQEYELLFNHLRKTID